MNDGDATDREGSFVDRLGELVLLAFATGDSVEGSWYLISGHLMVPDVSVTITRIDDSLGTQPVERTVSSTDPRPFEAKLETFVLSEYAAGEPLAGTWELRYGRQELPAWEVTIEFGDAEAEGDAGGFPLRTPDGR